ncbi:hypothetical protein [Brevibacillus borstelensis]|uniref:hypothetical protein n=1 Tax=Brevibacillus borstelensis TaxID=45462 RepID=UPI0030BB5BE1
MKKGVLTIVFCMATLLAGCTPNSQEGSTSSQGISTSNQVEATIPEGFEKLTLTDEQKEKILTDAKKNGVDQVFVPLYVKKGSSLVAIESGVDDTFDVNHIQSLWLKFQDEKGDHFIDITESPELILAGGVVIQEKETKLQNGIQAKWISYSNSRDNIKGASAGLYFQMDKTFIFISGGSNEGIFDKYYEEIAASLQPLKN